MSEVPVQAKSGASPENPKNTEGKNFGRVWLCLNGMELWFEREAGSCWADEFEIAEGLENFPMSPGRYVLLCDGLIVKLMQIAIKAKAISQAKPKLVQVVINGTALGLVSEEIAELVCDWEEPKPDF